MAKNQKKIECRKKGIKFEEAKETKAAKETKKKTKKRRKG